MYYLNFLNTIEIYIVYGILKLLHRLYPNILKGVGYMLFKGAIINETNKSFAVVWANYADLRSENSRTAYLEFCKPFFPDLPIILAGQDDDGNELYFGDTKLITWLKNSKNHPIHWITYGN